MLGGEDPLYEDFGEMVLQAAGVAPYHYQLRLATEGLPEVLAVETGAGKTGAVFFAWLWRRRFHPDELVRRSTPRWLVLCEPMRALTTQTESRVREWLANLHLDAVGPDGKAPVAVHIAMGGRHDDERTWRLHPEQDAVVIGTADLLLSRALNRGYGAGRFTWPIDFGLLNNGTHWVFDEVQLLGPALPTSRQLQAFRSSIGTAMPASSTWMSATVDRRGLSTIDNPYLADRKAEVRLDEDDRKGPLSIRLDAVRRVQEVQIGLRERRSIAIAQAAQELHRPGTLTLVVVNRVKTAQEVYRELTPSGGSAARGPETCLLHGRFRVADRERATAAALDMETLPGPGRIVVATQVVEAGIDVSATVLLTEAAPWPSIVQRAGRCNRDGKAADAVLAWVALEGDPAPYRRDDVDAAEAELRDLEGAAVTPTVLGEREVALSAPEQPILRRADLLSLFDTAPDVSGNDVDISLFIRDDPERDVFVAWSRFEGRPPSGSRPSTRELCKVPLGKDTAAFLARSHRNHGAWRVDPLGRSRDGRRASSEWVRVSGNDRVRPGEILVVHCDTGGYDPLVGWDPTATLAVPAVAEVAGDRPATAVQGAEEEFSDDSLSRAGEWVTLRDHLEEVEADVRGLVAAMSPAGLTADQLEAAAVAGRLHDIGKAHPMFQDSLLAIADEGDRELRRAGGPWAKSGTRRPLRYPRRSFRHELASALALVGDAGVLLSGLGAPDLAAYLVASHHGRIRLGIRSLPEADRDHYVLGVEEGELLPAIDLPGGQSPPTVLSLEPARMGRADGGLPSWTARALRLLDELGPFRLGFLEALVRVADWRASERHGGVAPPLAVDREPGIEDEEVADREVVTDDGKVVPGVTDPAP